MKYVLNGVAVAAALTIAAPVWAQTSAAPVTPSSPAAPPSASTAVPMEPMASHRMRGHRRTRTSQRTAVRRGAARQGGANDNIANQLNSQELSRVGGSTPGMAPAPGTGPGPGMAPGMTGSPDAGYGQPNQVYGIPGAGQPSASSQPAGRDAATLTERIAPAAHRQRSVQS